MGTDIVVDAVARCHSWRTSYLSDSDEGILTACKTEYKPSGRAMPFGTDGENEKGRDRAMKLGTGLPYVNW